MKTLKICLFALIGMIATQSCKNFHNQGSAKTKEAEEATKIAIEQQVKAEAESRKAEAESKKVDKELNIVNTQEYPNTKTMSVEDIKKQATRSVGDLKGQKNGVVQKDKAEIFGSSGSRSNDTYVDAYRSFGGVAPNVTIDNEVPPAPEKVDELPIDENKKDVFTSTFSIDVDNASYTYARKMLQNYNQMPDTANVRLEEMINYFDYDYPQPTDKKPFSINTEVASAPWDEKKQLLHIGLQGKELDYKNLKRSNLVFLVDVSGSMSSPNKLPLLKESFKLLLAKLDPTDKVAIVVYAGAAGVVLPSTAAKDDKAILNSLNQLQSGGSTAGGAGINLAYQIAKENFIKDGNNRVILATDGDFNVGQSSNADLLALIEEKRKSNIFLTALAFGDERYNDAMLEEITNAGNGNYFYVDNIDEARKIFEKEMLANLFVLSKDVKIQVEFNPAVVKSYKLIGYDNRVMENKDFANDKKDAGELGAGHSVTALYELVLQPNAPQNKPLVEVRLRYKEIDEDKSQLITQRVENQQFMSYSKSSDNFKLSAAVAAWGLMLDGKLDKNTANFNTVENLAKEVAGNDQYKIEFVKLVNISRNLAQVK